MEKEPDLYRSLVLTNSLCEESPEMMVTLQVSRFVERNSGKIRRAYQEVCMKNAMSKMKADDCSGGESDTSTVPTQFEWKSEPLAFLDDNRCLADYVSAHLADVNNALQTHFAFRRGSISLASSPAPRSNTPVAKTGWFTSSAVADASEPIVHWHLLVAFPVGCCVSA